MHWEILWFSLCFAFVYFLISGFRVGPEGKLSDLFRFGTYAESFALIMSLLIAVLAYQFIFQLGTEEIRPFVAFSFLIAWFCLLVFGRPALPNASTFGRLRLLNPTRDPDFFILEIGFFAYFLFLPFFVFNEHPNLLEGDYWLGLNGWGVIDLIAALILLLYTMGRLVSSR